MSSETIFYSKFYIIKNILWLSLSLQIKFFIVRILYLHQYFKTPLEGGAIRSYYIAQQMIARGHEVVMITSHNNPHYKIKWVDGIQVHYLPVYYDNSLKFIGRIKAFIQFYIKALRCAKNIQSVDLVYATSTPLTVGAIAYQLNQFKKWPYVFEVRDVWPEAPIQLGFIKNRLLIKSLNFITKKIYNHASKIITLSDAMKNYILETGTQTPIHVIPNMSDCSFFESSPKDSSLEKLYHVEGKFVISYFGAAGYVNEMDDLYELIAYCKHRNLTQYAFLIQAKGAYYKSFEQKIEALNFNQVHLLQYSAKDSIKNLLNVSDAILVSFKNTPILGSNSPNKFFDGLASGKLICTNTSGWIEKLIEDNEIGFKYEAFHPSDFFKKIEPYSTNPSMLIKVKSIGRKIAEETFNVEKLSHQVIDLIENKNMPLNIDVHEKKHA
jgi:glycosyltransferase involved in cell wall biosynthesis